MEALNFWYNVTKLKTVPLTAVSTSLKRTIGFYGHNSVHCHCHKEGKGAWSFVVYVSLLHMRHETDTLVDNPN